MSWDSIVGQQRVKRLLVNALESGRVPHAYLFYGPDGVGKDATAIEFAKVINCERGGAEACEACDSCARFASLQHPNVRLVFALPVGKGEKSGDPPMAKLANDDVENVREQIHLKAVNRYHTIAVPRATTIKVNSIRDIKREAALTSYTRGKKVIIIIDAENMNDEAANALLKTLEEPTDDTLLILTTAYRERLFPTVVSRCQGVRFDFLTEDEIARHLQKVHGLDLPRASPIARLARGSMSRALELLAVDLQEQREAVLSFLRTIYSTDVFELARLLEALAREYDRDDLYRFLQLLQLWLRDALCTQEGYTIINIDQQESLERFARRFPGLDYGSLLEQVDAAVSQISKNAYIPLVLTVLALHIKSAIVSRNA